jgi:hypothetical protein
MSFVGFLLLILVLMYATKNFPGAISSLFWGVLKILAGLLIILIIIYIIGIR